ncbi:MAG: caspase family protein, partial [Microcystaceae cyanobacterium]
MMGLANLYALLVGIDRYTSPVPPLMGCVNDILNFKQYLEGRSSPGQLQTQTLLNEAATREAVIAGFRDFLGQAGADDLALFYYAGHGAQEASP